MGGSSTSRGHWDVGKSAKKPRKEDADDPFSSLPGSPAQNGLVLPPQSIRNVASGSQELRSHRLSIAQTAFIDGIVAHPPQQPTNVTEAANAFNQLRVRTAPERNADDISPSISGADHPPSPKKRKAAGSLQEDSSTQQPSGNDQQETSTAAPSGPVGELLQVFEQIQLNKDFYDAIARTESCAGEAPQSNTRAEVDRAAFQAAVHAATTVLRNQVKDLAEKGQEASPAFLQAYALNAIQIFATQAAESSYSGEDLGGEGYFTSTSVERPHSSSHQKGGLHPRDDNEIDSNRTPAKSKRLQQEQQQLPQGGDGNGNASGNRNGDDEIDKEITVLERTASAMVLHSPTTRSNATPTTTQNNRTPTASGILSGNGNSSFDPELTDTAGMVEVGGSGGISGGDNVALRRRERGREGNVLQQRQQQQQQERNEGQRNGGDVLVLPPQTPGEPTRPEHDYDTDDENDINLNNNNNNINNREEDEDLVFSGDGNIDIDQSDDEEEQQQHRGVPADDEEEEQHAALVREMSILEAVDADYPTDLENVDHDGGIDGIVQQGIVQPQEEESPPSRDENENRFFDHGAAANAANTNTTAVPLGGAGGGGGLFGPSTINRGGVGAGGARIPTVAGGSPVAGVLLHQQEYHHQQQPIGGVGGRVSPSAAGAAGLASPHSSPVPVPQRPQAAAGHREKRDPRPSSSGGPSRLSNDPPKRQRKGPGLVVGSAPQHDNRRGPGVEGIHNSELFSSSIPPSAPPPAEGINNRRDPTTVAIGVDVGSLVAPQPPLGDSDGPAVSHGSIGGGGGGGHSNKKAMSSGKIYRKEEEGGGRDKDEGDDEGSLHEDSYKKKNKASLRGDNGGNEKEGDNNNKSSPAIGGAAPPRGKKRDAAVVVREGASLSISLETIPAAELGGGRGAWGSSLVCADLTVHDVASQYWPSFKKAVERANGGITKTGGDGVGGNLDGTNDNGTNNQGVREVRELSLAEKEMVQELTAALEAAILGAVASPEGRGDGSSPLGGRRLNSKVKSLAAASAFDELWKEREQRHLLELQEEGEQMKKQQVGEGGAATGSEKI